jgi:hypothetical protein
MTSLKRIFQGWQRVFKPRRRVVADLPEAVLAQALAEARFLHTKHAVDVRPLAAGEAPAEPKPAEPPTT